jgi:hypothetical protein
MALSQASYTSERHERAKQSGKYTAGEARKHLKSVHGIECYARDIKKMYKALHGYEPEWHHSGFYKPSSGAKKKMGRTFFFTAEELDDLATRWQEAQMAINLKEQEDQRIVQGFFWKWERTGRRWTKVLCTYEGPKADAPKRFVELSQTGYQTAQQMEGKVYTGWNEPERIDFET